MGMVDRRALIVGAASVGAMSGLILPGAAKASPVPPSGQLNFAIFRNGKPFGSYRVGFVTAGDQMTVTTDVAMNARVAKLTVFDYKHHCEEIWRKGQFAELHSRSVRDNDQARADTVSAVRGEFGLHITTNKGPLSAPAKALPLTHWNPAVLQGTPIFNPQDGLMLQLQVSNMGKDNVLQANGSQVMGNHWALRGPQQIDEWYDDAGVWAGLKAVFPDKSLIEYRRV